MRWWRDGEWHDGGWEGKQHGGLSLSVGMKVDREDRNTAPTPPKTCQPLLSNSVKVNRKVKDTPLFENGVPRDITHQCALPGTHTSYILNGNSGQR